ncbi:hypothetical protein GCK32_015717, partial [Trichostrongylus colubriformis]
MESKKVKEDKKKLRFKSTFPRKGKSTLTIHAPERHTRKAKQYGERNEAKGQAQPPRQERTKRVPTKAIKKGKKITKAPKKR